MCFVVTHLILTAYVIFYKICNEKEVENLLSCVVLRQVSGKPDQQTKPSKSKRHVPLYYALLRRESLPFQTTFASKSKPPSDNLSRLQPDLSSPHLHSSHSLLPHPPTITFSPLLNFHSSRVLSLFLRPLLRIPHHCMLKRSLSLLRIGMFSFHKLSSMLLSPYNLFDNFKKYS